MATRHFLARTHSSDEYSDGDCGYAVICLDDDFAQQLLALKATFQKAKAEADASDLFEFYLWDGHAQYVDRHAIETVLSEDAADQVDDYELLEIAPDKAEAFDQHVERTECDQLIIREDAFAFVAIPKHTGITVTTDPIPYDKLTANAALPQSAEARTAVLSAIKRFADAADALLDAWDKLTPGTAVTPGYPSWLPDFNLVPQAIHTWLDRQTEEWNPSPTPHPRPEDPCPAKSPDSAT